MYINSYIILFICVVCVFLDLFELNVLGLYI